MVESTIIGVFENKVFADAALRELETSGFNSHEFSLITRKEVGKVGHVGSKGGSAISGATAGSVIGGLAGIIIGLSSITISGLGPLLVGGPLAIALGLTGFTAAAVGGATTGIVAGGIIGGLAGLGLSEEEARTYEDSIRQGAVLLAVPVSSGANNQVARDIFARYDAHQIRSISSAVRPNQHN